MKKYTLIFVTIMTISSSTLYSQQLKNWYIGPNGIDMSIAIGSPVPVPLAPAFGTVLGKVSTNVANGYYDDIGNLLFYIADQKIYDFNNEELGFINNNGAEISIVPFDNNDQCNRKFNVFYSNGGFADASSLWRAVVDMNSFSVSTYLVDTINFRGIPSTEFGAIAVGKVISNVRNLYFLAGPGTLNSKEGAIKKVIINNDGSVVPAGRIYPTITEQNLNAGGELFTRELEISPDGKWLGWASFEQVNPPGYSAQYRYHFLELNNIGNYISSSYGQFNHPSILGNNVKGFRGVEFYLGSNGLYFFVGAGSNGIYSIKFPVNIPPTSLNFNHVFGSDPDLGYSQIELANNSFMYVSSGLSAFNIAAFNTISPLAIQPSKSFSLINPAPPSTSFGGFTLYTLPDQIDGQDYSLITPAAVAPFVTYNTLTFPLSGGSGQSATWTYGSNPVNNATSPIHVIHELRIKQNSTVTIKGMTFKFSPEAKVIIEEGSTLILDELSGTPTIFTSNTLTDHCQVNYSWQGVEVWGTSNLSQIPPLAPALFKQGKLVVKNYSRIENANWGGRAWKPIFPIPATITSSGGIIQVSSYGEFRNCKVDVEFKPYQNIFAGIKRANKSAFTFAKFTNSFSQYPFSTAPEHVIVEGCNGIRFTDCEFLHDGSQGMFDLQSKGIKSLNSNFVVTRNTFENLYRGIDAKRTTGTTTFSVYHSTFIDNQTGISASGINRITLQKNNFNIGGNLKTGATTQVGMSLAACSGYIIEENEFFLSTSQVPSISKWGIITNSSGSAPNQIYKNTFTDINFGNVSQGVNRNNSISNATGLQYLCNVNASNDNYDFYISNKGGSNVGIATSQGNPTYPAQNSFSLSGPLFSDFNNTTSNPINYYWQSIPPTYFNAPLVNLISTASTNSCPSHICPPPCDIARLLSSLEVAQFSSMYDSAETVSWIFYNMTFQTHFRSI
jgi:hypothetical protein